MDVTEKDIRNLFANSGQLDRDEVAMLLFQLVERIQNLERAPQRTWEGLSVFEINDLVENTEYEDYRDLVERTEAKLKGKNK